MAPVDLTAFAPDVARYRQADHGWLAELDAVTVHAGEPHQRMGTRAVAEVDWFVADEHRAHELALRRRLVDEAGEHVVAIEPGSEPACAEAAALVDAWIAADRPAWRAEAPGRADDPPLVRAGLAVQDDLCVMERDEHGWRFTAGVVCFPSYWRLADKIGRHQEAVHGPVPHYADDVADRVNRFFDRLPPGRIVGRRNWGFVAHPLLFIPGRDELVQPESFALDHLWMRSERQTLRRLPDTGAVLFTIRAQLAPAAAIEQHPDVAARLLDAMRNWSPELVVSRGGRHGWYEQVVGWLGTIAAG